MWTTWIRCNEEKIRTEFDFKNVKVLKLERYIKQMYVYNLKQYSSSFDIQQ